MKVCPGAIGKKITGVSSSTSEYACIIWSVHISARARGSRFPAPPRSQTQRVIVMMRAGWGLGRILGSIQFLSAQFEARAGGASTVRVMCRGIRSDRAD